MDGTKGRVRKAGVSRNAAGWPVVLPRPLPLSLLWHVTASVSHSRHRQAAHKIATKNLQTEDDIKNTGTNEGDETAEPTPGVNMS